MSTDISISNGANLNLKGLASMDLEVAKKSLNYALNPDDFFGLTPRMFVKEGDQVSLGQPIFHDKSDESIKIASPVSGKIIEIVRGAKRKILNISNQNLKIVEDWIDKSDNFKFMCEDKSIRSSTSITVLIKDEWFTKHNEEEQRGVLKKLFSLSAHGEQAVVNDGAN